MSFTVSHGNGIAVKYKKQTILLDPSFADFISVVSHAHSDHCPEEIIKKPYCTAETAEFAKIRNPSFHSNILKEGKPVKFDGFSIKLLSAGHILGSAQTLVEADGKSILYTGDFKVRENLTCKKIEIQNADVLITEATYGYPAYQIPDSKLVREQFSKWVKEQIKRNKKVNVGAYTLGKAQEAIRILNDEGIIPQVSDMVRKFSESYKKFGVKLEFLEKDESGEVEIKPMHVVSQLRGGETANCVLTG
jgi:Cft2 family RNA processing exonuclease